MTLTARITKLERTNQAKAQNPGCIIIREIVDDGEKGKPVVNVVKVRELFGGSDDTTATN